MGQTRYLFPLQKPEPCLSKMGLYQDGLIDFYAAVITHSSLNDVNHLVTSEVTLPTKTIDYSLEGCCIKQTPVFITI